MRVYENKGWKCWSPSHNIDEIDGKYIHANSARQAAEFYAEVLYPFFNEKFQTIEVCVKETNNHYGKVYTYNVEVVVKPVFEATPKQ